MLITINMVLDHCEDAAVSTTLYLVLVPLSSSRHHLNSDDFLRV